MPDLLDRCLGLLTPEESHLVLPPDSLMAAMRERQRGRITRAAIKSALRLSDADDTGLNTVYQNCISITPPYTFEEVRDLLMLGATRNRLSQTGDPYYTKAQIKTRLGL